MNWFEAWLLVNLGWFCGFGIAMGVVILGLTIWKVAAYEISWDRIDKVYSYTCDDAKKDKLWKERKDLRTKSVRAVYRGLTTIIIIWTLASLVPSTSDIFKIVAIKYGYEAATSDRAKNLADNSLKVMEQTLNLLNKKLAAAGGK